MFHRWLGFRILTVPLCDWLTKYHAWRSGDPGGGPIDANERASGGRDERGHQWPRLHRRDDGGLRWRRRAGVHGRLRCQDHRYLTPRLRRGRCHRHHQRRRLAGDGGGSIYLRLTDPLLVHFLVQERTNRHQECGEFQSLKRTERLIEAASSRRAHF